LFEGENVDKPLNNSIFGPFMPSNRNNITRNKTYTPNMAVNLRCTRAFRKLKKKGLTHLAVGMAFGR